MKNEIINKVLKENHLDVIFSCSYQTRLWYTNVFTSNGFIFIEKNNANLIVDNRYIEYVKKNAKNAKIHLYKKGFLEKFTKSKNKIYKNIGIEKDYLTISDFDKLKKWFPKATFVKICIKKLRIIKTNDEIQKIKKACLISLSALDSIKNMIKPGIKESTISHHLNFKMKELGADKESFDSIVVSGPRGSLPHGSPSNKQLQSGELVTIDFGAYYKGYASDITRTFKIGKIKNPKLNEIFDIVKEAQKAGIEAVKPGVTNKEIDLICRDYIKSKGYAKYFIHSTGHGLGIDVHELPIISNNTENETVLKEGMVITVEPGIYIKGLGGVRFEDDILVTKNGHTILSTR